MPDIATKKEVCRCAQRDGQVDPINGSWFPCDGCETAIPADSTSVVVVRTKRLERLYCCPSCAGKAINPGAILDQSGAEESTTAPTLPSAAEVLREVLDHFRAAEHLPDELYATALLVAYGGAS